MSEPRTTETSSDNLPEPPRLFISYSHTSEPYKARVLELALALRTVHRIEVRLDRWYLHEGDNRFHFMVREVKDADKVLILSDARYTEKANNNEGGAGVETEIITQEFFEEVRQEEGDPRRKKFAVAVMEADSDGNWPVPDYAKARIHFDFTDPDKRLDSLGQVERWAYDKPLLEAPPVGGRPEFLDVGPSTGTAAVATHAVAALSQGRPSAVRAAEDYFDRLLAGLESFLPSEPEGMKTAAQYDAATREEALRLHGPVTEAERVIGELVRYGASSGEAPRAASIRALRRLLKGCFPLVDYRFADESLRLSDWQRMLFRYAVPDLLRAAAGSLIRVEDFTGFFELTADYQVETYGGRSLEVEGFGALQPFINHGTFASDSVMLRTNRAGLLSRAELIQTDALLTLRAFGMDQEDEAHYRQGWFPDGAGDPRLIARSSAPLPLFAQAMSKRFLEKLAQAFGLDGAGLIELVKKASGSEGNKLSRLNFGAIALPNSLGTMP